MKLWWSLIALLASPATAMISVQQPNYGVFVASAAGGGGGADYSDITFYHDADAKDDANYAAGSPTVSYGSGILLTAGVVGTAWDNNNDGFDNVVISSASNLIYAGGRLGFYWKPQELADGYIIGSDTSEFYAQYLSANTTRFRYQGTTEDFTTNFSIGTAYFLEFKFTGNTMEVFKDGVSIGSVVGSSTGNYALRLFSPDGNQWDAHIDQVFMSSNSSRDLNAIKNCTNCHP